MIDFWKKKVREPFKRNAVPKSTDTDVVTGFDSVERNKVPVAGGTMYGPLTIEMDNLYQRGGGGAVEGIPSIHLKSLNSSGVDITLESQSSDAKRINFKETISGTTNTSYILYEFGEFGIYSAQDMTISCAQVPTGIAGEGLTIQNVVSPVGTHDAATKGYVDSVRSTYSVEGHATVAAAPADNANLYFGRPIHLAPSTSANNRRFVVPKAGTVTTASMQFWAVTVAGSGEAIIGKIRHNNTTDYSVESISTTSPRRDFESNTLSIAVSVGDTLEFLFDCPTWATNPTDVYCSGMLVIEA